MSSNYCICFLLFFLLTGCATSSLISYDVLKSYRSAGRALLQIKSKCSENFEDKNYTTITSQCKGPQYPADKCCEAFKEFACPISDKINDEKTDCAATMFSYINLYGKFPPGLFAHKCREGKEGLKCKDVPPPSNGAASQSTWLLLAASFLVLLRLML